LCFRGSMSRCPGFGTVQPSRFRIMSDTTLAVKSTMGTMRA
jgi:hypothetical protein